MFRERRCPHLVQRGQTTQQRQGSWGINRLEQREQIWRFEVQGAQVAIGQPAALRTGCGSGIVVDGDAIAAVPHVTSTGESAEYIAVEGCRRGDVVPMKAGGVELARNIGKKPFYEILVELKK